MRNQRGQSSDWPQKSARGGGNDKVEPRAERLEWSKKTPGTLVAGERGRGLDQVLNVS